MDVCVSIIIQLVFFTTFVVIVVIYGPELKNNRKTSFFPLSRPHMNQTSAVNLPSFILSHHVQQQVDRFSVARRHLVRLLADLQQTGRGQLCRKTRREQRVSEEQLLSFVSHVSHFISAKQNVNQSVSRSPTFMQIC